MRRDAVGRQRRALLVRLLLAVDHLVLHDHVVVALEGGLLLERLLVELVVCIASVMNAR